MSGKSRSKIFDAHRSLEPGGEEAKERSEDWGKDSVDNCVYDSRRYCETWEAQYAKWQSILSFKVDWISFTLIVFEELIIEVLRGTEPKWFAHYDNGDKVGVNNVCYNSSDETLNSLVGT